MGYTVHLHLRARTDGTVQRAKPDSGWHVRRHLKDMKVRDLVLAMSASTDSAINRVRFGNIDFAPTAGLICC